MIRHFSTIMAMLAAAFTAPAMANNTISLESEIFVERVTNTSGRTAVILERPTSLIPGDRLVFVVKYKNTGAAPASDVVITNPIPNAIQFQETLDGTEQVSVDGGKNWARLEKLRIALKNGESRPASPSDVTHIRWVILEDITNGDEGKLTFRGVVK